MFYRSPDGETMMVVPVETEPTFAAGTPEVVFAGNYVGRYAISPDGQRFLVFRDPEKQTEMQGVTQLHVVFNWFEELKAKMREAEE